MIQINGRRWWRGMDKRTGMWDFTSIAIEMLSRTVFAVTITAYTVILTSPYRIKD